MAEPQNLEDKKQILIKALKKRYEIHYNGVKPIPYIQERLYCVDNVFVESGVNASVGGAASYAKAIQWERLESYKNIFNDSRMRSNRRIIEGEPGYGKSTLTLQLAYDWCNGVPDSPLYDVEILILLKLRQMGNVTSIYKAIKLYLIPDERRVKIRDIREIIESCRSVAFQLDGYDEYPEKDKENDVGRIMMLQMFPESDVTLTTRYLPKDYDTPNTTRIKLTGFDDAARDEYIRKAVCGNNEKAVAKVKKGLKENVIIDDLCQVPLFFSMFSHMTHEREDFQKFKSVTDFFRYMMRCFHHHTRNKAEEYNVERYATMFEANHEELSKVAFEGLSRENQQIVWEKVSLIKRLGEGFYNHHIRVGILVEEEVIVITDAATPSENIKTKTEVSFYHKIFCEWFASFHVTGIAADVEDPAELEPRLGKMDPFDLQYVFRFACGLNSGAGSNIIEYLKSKKGGDKFAILCILEQSGKFDGIMETVKDLCSETLPIREDDTKLLQRSTIQLLQIASSHDIIRSTWRLFNYPIDSIIKIPICHLSLKFSFNKVQHGDVLLKSGLCLPPLSSLEKISINEGSGNLISEDNVIGLLNYIQSEKFRELWFFNCKLPEFIRPGIIPETAKSRQIKVLWPSHVSQLDLHSGEWRKADDIQTIKSLCSGTVAIDNRTSESVQRSVIEVLVKASNHDIPIFSVDLVRSFNKVDEDDITLYSGLSLPIITSIERMSIVTEAGREMNKHEVNGILNYLQHSQRFKQLVFDFCLLPSSIPSSALSGLKSNINVFWRPYGFGKRSYRLNNKTGEWLLHRETASLFPNKAIGDKLTDADYTEEVGAFREHYRNRPWQQENRGSGLT
ncbi:uncharacterized protein [Apostichopus japonicus]|uniref:uncharacterized protein n=1 Tax=Stichopus japonicus TaxID=307972 RepID=UPI003AB29FDB